MDQIIIEHYKNSCNFLSLKNFKNPFIVKNGLYVNNRQVFKYKLRDKYEFLIEGILINKKKEGIWIYCDESGNKMSEENWKNGKQDGFCISYYNNGNKMSEENWKNGNRKGFCIFYYNNGNKMSEENWKNGNRKGFWISWYEDGQKKPEDYYKNGILI